MTDFNIPEKPYPYTNSYTLLKVIRKVICDHFCIKVADITGRNRKYDIMKARHLLHTIIYKLGSHGKIMPLSLEKIGYLTKRDHSTVINSIKQVEDSAGYYREELAVHWIRIFEILDEIDTKKETADEWVSAEILWKENLLSYNETMKLESIIIKSMIDFKNK